MIDVYKKMLYLMMTTLLVVILVDIGLSVPTQTYQELDQRAPMDIRERAGFTVEQMSGPFGEAPMGALL